MTHSGTNRRRGPRVLPVAVVLLALQAMPVAAQQAAAPAGLDHVLAKVERLAASLERLRISAVPAPANIAAIVEQGQAMLARADKAVAGQLRALKADVAKSSRTLREITRMSAVRCRLAVEKADLYRLGAAAVPDDHSMRTTLLDEAIRVYRELRVEFIDITPGLMGYIGECRARRLAGDVKGAHEVLKPLRAVLGGRSGRGEADLRRLVKLEELETTLLSDVREAMRQTETWRRTLPPGSTWRARAEWLLARGSLAMARSAPAAPDVKTRLSAALERARSKGIAAAAPASDRLALLAEIERLMGERVLTRDELLHWADLRASGGHLDAIGLYDRARRLPDTSLTPIQLLRMAQLLSRKRQSLRSAELCGELLGAADVDATLRSLAIHLRAVNLLRAFRNSAAQLPARRRDLLAALRAVIESSLAEGVRRDALRQWVFVRSQAAVPPGRCARMIDAHKDLAEADGYLRHARAADLWRLLRSQLDAGQVDSDRASRVAQQILSDARAAQAVADRRKRPAVAARAALLEVQVLTHGPARDLREALKKLEAKRPMLQGDPVASAAAGQLHVELLLDLGMVEQAGDAFAQWDQHGQGASGDAALLLAEAWARRYDSVRAEGKAEV